MMNEDSDDYGNVSRNLRGCLGVVLGIGVFFTVLTFLLM